MDAKKTGELIANCRRRLGLTQAELAQQLHVSDKAVSRWETGRGMPDISCIEELAALLGISVAELLQGEIYRTDSANQEDEVAVSSGTMLSHERETKMEASILDYARNLLERARFKHAFLGLLIGAICTMLMVAHLTSPIYIKNADEALSLETLADGRMIAVLGKEVAGYTIETDPADTSTLESSSGATADLKDISLSCYQTRWGQLTGAQNEKIILLGKASELGRVYYYPASGGDELLYSQHGDESEVRVTLPRLLYSFWLVIGLGASIVGIVIALTLKNHPRARLAQQVAFVPIAFTLSTLLVLTGHWNEVYNAQFYFTWIVILAFLIYALGSYSVSILQDRSVED